MVLIRKSMIEEFHFCPYKFKKRYIDESIVDLPNQSMLMGTRFHEVAEKFFDNHESALCYDFTKHYNNHEVKMIDWFMDMEMKRLAWLIDQDRQEEWMPLHREVTLTNEELNITGTIDRVDWIDKERGIIRLVEYKTSKKVDDASLRRQLGFYSYLYNNTLNMGKVDKLRLINPRLQVVIDYDVPSVESIMKHVDNLKDSMLNNNFPPKCNPIKLSTCRCCSPDEVLPD